MKARLEKLLLFLDQAIEHAPGGYAATVEEHRATVADAIKLLGQQDDRIEYLHFSVLNPPATAPGPRSEGEGTDEQE